MRVDPLLVMAWARDYALNECAVEDAATIEDKLRNYFEIPDKDVARLLEEGDRLRGELAAAGEAGWRVERAGPNVWTATKHDPRRGRVSETGGTLTDVLKSTRLADERFTPAAPRLEIVDGLAG